MKYLPKTAEEYNNLGWSLATNPNPARRNGALAVIYARKACQQTDYRKTIFVGTLAAAYAEAGYYEDAIATAQRACELAAIDGESNLLKMNQELLLFYQQHQPFHEKSR